MCAVSVVSCCCVLCGVWWCVSRVCVVWVCGCGWVEGGGEVWCVVCVCVGYVCVVMVCVSCVCVCGVCVYGHCVFVCV